MFDQTNWKKGWIICYGKKAKTFIINRIGWKYIPNMSVMWEFHWYGSAKEKSRKQVGTALNNIIDGRWSHLTALWDLFWLIAWNSHFAHFRFSVELHSPQHFQGIHKQKTTFATFIQHKFELTQKTYVSYSQTRTKHWTKYRFHSNWFRLLNTSYQVEIEKQQNHGNVFVIFNLCFTEIMGIFFEYEGIQKHIKKPTKTSHSYLMVSLSPFKHFYSYICLLDVAILKPKGLKNFS